MSSPKGLPDPADVTFRSIAIYYSVTSYNVSIVTGDYSVTSYNVSIVTGDYSVTSYNVSIVTGDLCYNH